MPGLGDSPLLSAYLLENLGQGVVVYDSELRYVVWSRFMEELTGVPAVDILGTHCVEVFPYLHEFGIDALLQRALRGEAGLVVDLRVRIPASGREIWTENRIGPFRDHDARIVGVLAIVTDISERKRNEQALLESKSFAREVVDSVNEGIVVYDTEFRYLLFNRFFEMLAGVREQDLLGRRVFDVYPDLLAHGVEALMRRALGGETVIAKDFMGRRHGTMRLLPPGTQPHDVDDPGITWTLSKFTPHRDKNASVVGVIVTVLDVSELARSRGALLASNQQLQRLTAHLEQVREQERTRIAREIHDELGSTLTAIKLNVDMLIERAERGRATADPMLLHASRLAETATESMRKVITELRPSVLDHLGLWAAIEWYAAQLREHTGLHCAVAIAGDSARLQVDPERSTGVFRIVQEALTNVVRHAQATRVEIRAQRTAAGVLIEVEDDGQGMAEERLLKTDSWGVLGMRERARHLGGQLTMTRGADRGTVVTLRVPIPYP